MWPGASPVAPATASRRWPACRGQISVGIQPEKEVRARRPTVASGAALGQKSSRAGQFHEIGKAPGFGFEDAVPQTAESIVAAALVLISLFNQAAIEQSREQAVQRTNLEPDAAARLTLDFFHDSVAVARPLGQCHEYVKVGGLEGVRHIS